MTYANGQERFVDLSQVGDKTRILIVERRKNVLLENALWLARHRQTATIVARRNDSNEIQSGDNKDVLAAISPCFKA